MYVYVYIVRLYLCMYISMSVRLHMWSHCVQQLITDFCGRVFSLIAIFLSPLFLWHPARQIQIYMNNPIYTYIYIFKHLYIYIKNRIFGFSFLPLFFRLFFSVLGVCKAFKRNLLLSELRKASILPIDWQLLFQACRG